MINSEMFKKQNNILYNNIFVKLMLFVSIIFVFVFSVWYSFEVPLGDALNRFYQNQKRNALLNKVNGKISVWNLYKKSLESVSNNEFEPIFEAVEKVVSKVNEDYDCQLNQQDIINILYYSNDNFKRDLKNNLDLFEKPEKDDMWSSCNRLNVCVYDPKNGQLNNTVTLNNLCQDNVNQKFMDYYTNSYYTKTLSVGSEWSNLFWNYSMEDSSYDIINDIYILSEILFAVNKEPVETLFYKMPTVEYQDVVYNENVFMDIDWFSPYNEYITTTWDNNTWSDSNNWSWSNSSSGVWWGNYENEWDDNIINDDNEINMFIESINVWDWYNDDVVVWWNQCVSWFDIAWLSWSLYEEIITTGSNLVDPEEYLEELLDDIDEISCNNDWVYQDWESLDCPDNQSNGTWELPPIDEIEELLNWAQQWTWGNDIDPQVLSCFQKCQDVPCNAMSCDKIMCYAKCACQVYESPYFDPWVTPGLTSVFKIHFCIIPVINNPVSKDKTVYNINSVFSEIYFVLKWLRNSGELTINKKTKEFLDTSLKDNNFGEQLSFSLNTASKPTQAKELDMTKEQKQQEFNKNLMEWILWFWAENNNDIERNKYVVYDDPCIHKVEKEDFDTIEAKNNAIQECQQDMNKGTELSYINDDLIDQKIVVVNSSIDTFLMQNRDFWYAVDDMFRVWNDSAELMSNK